MQVSTQREYTIEGVSESLASVIRDSLISVVTDEEEGIVLLGPVTHEVRELIDCLADKVLPF